MSRILFFIWLVTLSLQSCHKVDTVSSQAQLKSDTAAIRSFLTEYNIQATKVNAGFWYSIDTLGNGVYPVLSDSVTISYTAKLIPSLQLVDDTTSTVLLSASISGLQQGLVLFPSNSYGKFYIPSGLAFGVSAHNDNRIRPNANLLYEVKLIEVKGTRLANDIAAIDAYLQNHSIVAKHDTVSGIRYTIDSMASNASKPGANDFITVTGTERILSDTLVTSLNAFPMALKDQVTAWRIMLPKYVAVGTKITMYVPSGYAYGSSSTATIPANSNFVYVINLIKVN
jgi:FKBP-type peptidyl-prolyl cis-trans isomerase FkpA